MTNKKFLSNEPKKGHYSRVFSFTMIKRKVARNKAFLLILLSMLPLITACAKEGDSSERMSINRLSEVREKGSDVMPFDLDKTLHTFEKTGYGGVQIVSIRDSVYTDQLIPIREHLEKIASDFKNGNFSDPINIHGSEMAGLETLQTNTSKFSVKYSELENGAKLEYRSTDGNIISAIHLWFEAQITDHGMDATDNTGDLFPGFSKEHICQMHPETCSK